MRNLNKRYQTPGATFTLLLQKKIELLSGYYKIQIQKDKRITKKNVN